MLDRSNRKHILIMLSLLNICLVVIAVLVVANVYRIGQGSQSSNEMDDIPSSFSIAQMPYDINPGQEYVLYTNYACPYCAAFYRGAKDSNFSYTTRINLLDKEGVFSSQKLVSAFMLKTYRVQPDTYQKVEEYLYENQDYWTVLEDEQLLTLLNEMSGLEIEANDLCEEMGEIEQGDNESPDDLEFVPSLYSEGMRHDGLMTKMISA